jgi:glutamate formiminotransferase
VGRLAATCLSRIDLSAHRGVHPRLGALDVVPFAPLETGPLEPAVAAREAALAVVAGLGIPAFRFGPVDATERSLPDVRGLAFRGLLPDAGPTRPHPSAGATAVGARQPLLAWNAWLQGASIGATRALAASLRGPSVRALGFEVTGATQVSCNLLEPDLVTPLDVYRAIEAGLPEDAHVVRCELVGLVPEAVLAAVPRDWWARLDLDEDRGVCARVSGAGLAG